MRSGGGQWYGGPGGPIRPADHERRSRQTGAVCHHLPDRSGGVWTGGWEDRRGPMTRIDHGLSGPAAHIVSGMQLINPPRPQRNVGSLIVGTLLGSCLVAGGLGLAFLALETPVVSTLVPGSRAGTPLVLIALLVWALALIAGGALLFAGTNRLATIAATIRSRRRQSPVVAALGSLPADVSVAIDVEPTDGRPIPELVIGPFGVAVIHELRATRRHPPGRHVMGAQDP